MAEDPPETPKSFHLAPRGAPDSPHHSTIPWVILVAFIGLCLLMLWMKGR
jgi:hypothetical protein